MTPQERYLQALEALRRAESAAARWPTAGNLALVRDLADRAAAAYAAVPVAPRPATIGNPPRPLSLARTGPVRRRSSRSDWHPLSFRGGDN